MYHNKRCALKRFVVGVSCIASLAIGPYGYGNPQANSASELYVLSLEQLIDIPISGVTRTTASFLSTPASINPVDRAVLDIFLSDSISEITPLIPNYYSAHHDDGAYSNISSRGHRSGNAGREVLVLLDGMRLDNWFAGGAGYSIPVLSLYGAKRVEFIRGAISQVYGSNAFTGVININSDANLRNAKITTGINDYYRFQANTGGEFKQFKHKLQLDFQRDEGEDFWITKPNGGEQVTLSDGINADSLYYQAHINEWSFYSFASSASHENYYIGSLYAPGFTQARHDFFNSSFKHEKSWNDAISTELQAGYRFFDFLIEKAEYEQAGAFSAISSPPSTQAPQTKTVSNSEHEYWLNQQTNWQASEGLNLQLGFEWRDIYKHPFVARSNFDIAALANSEFPIASSENIDIETHFLPRKNEQLFGAYLQSIVSINQANELTLGVRHDRYKIAGSKTTPRIAWVNKLNKHNSLKFIYGEAFRAPVANELFLQNNPVSVGNEDLMPETIKTSEVIWAMEKPGMRLQLAYYDSQIEDPIIQEDTGTIRQYENLEQSESKGFEGNFNYQLDTYTIGRINFSHATELPDDQYRSPKTLAGASVAYQRGKWKSFYAVNYVDKRESNPRDSANPVTLDSYWLHNINFQYRLTKRNNFSLKINNILDKEYFDTSAGDTTNEVPRRGRELYLEYTFKFGDLH